MSFKASNLQVGGVKTDVETPQPSITHVELTKRELEFMLIAIKNGLFKGEYVETCYNLTLKLQNHFIKLKD